MGIKFTNNAISNLAADLTSGATSFSVKAGEGAKFPVLGGGDYFRATLQAVGAMEIVKVTARASDAFTVVRGEEGTNPTAFASGSSISLYLTNQDLIDLVNERQAPVTATGVLKGTGSAVVTATANTDYLTPPTGTAMQKAGNGGALANAVAGTDYLAPYGSQTANTFFAAPNGAAGVPTFRNIFTADIRGINANNFAVAMPTGTDAIEFCTVSNGDFSANVEIWFTVHTGGYAQSKRYFCPLMYHGTVGVWQKMLPVSSSGPYSGNDAEIDVNITGQVATFRVRRTAGAVSGVTAWITLVVSGDPLGTTVAVSSTTYASPAVTATYAPTSITQINGKTGINNDNPAYTLDVNGTVNAVGAITAPSISGSASKWTTPRLLAGNSVDGSADAPFANKFIVQGTADAGLSGAQFLGAMSAGLLKNSGATGILSIANSSVDYVVPQAVTGIVKSSGLNWSAAVAGTDYLAPPSGTAIQKANSGGALANAVAGTDYAAVYSITGLVKSAGTVRSQAVSGTDYAPATSGASILKGNSAGGFAAAVAGTDYQSAQSVTGIVKSSGTTRSAAVAGTDYLAPPSGTAMLKAASGAALANATAGTDYFAPGANGRLACGRITTGVFYSGTPKSTYNIATDVGYGTMQIVLASGGCAITTAAETVGVMVRLIMDCTSGTPTWPSANIYWPNGQVPSWQSGPSKLALVSMVWLGAYWMANVTVY